MTTFNPEKDIPSLQGKTIFVTGGTAGIGRYTILNLAKHAPAQLYFSGRSSSSADSLIAEVRQIDPSVQITFVQMDMSSLSAIGQAVSALLPSMPRLDVLICNAGVMAVPTALSQDGIEIHFAINHLGHAMIIRHLLPVLESTAKLPGTDVRIVVLASEAWKMGSGRGISYSRLRSGYDGFVNRWLAYGQSKFANLIYAAELARRCPSIITVALQPGVVSTGLINSLGFWDRAFIRTGIFLQRIPLLAPEEGCHNSLWAAVGAKRPEMVNGAYYLPVGRLADYLVQKDKVARDPEQAKKLWEWTEEVLNKHSL